MLGRNLKTSSMLIQTLVGAVHVHTTQDGLAWTDPALPGAWGIEV